MYFEFSDFYKRDTIFSLSEEKNKMDLLTLKTGQILKIDKPLEFEVDKIDDYIESYDLLPTFNTPLVSAKFKSIFDDLTNDVQFVRVRITDKNNNENGSFYFMNILNILSIMDESRSLVEIKKYRMGDIKKIKKLYVREGSLKGHSIVRMKEHKSFIIVTEEFKKRCEDAKLKGTHFREEGYSIHS
jgi:hypothetical protein